MSALGRTNCGFKTGRAASSEKRRPRRAEEDLPPPLSPSTSFEIPPQPPNETQDDGTAGLLDTCVPSIFKPLLTYRVSRFLIISGSRSQRQVGARSTGIFSLQPQRSPPVDREDRELRFVKRYRACGPKNSKRLPHARAREGKILAVVHLVV